MKLSSAYSTRLWHWTLWIVLFDQLDQRAKRYFLLEYLIFFILQDRWFSMSLDISLSLFFDFFLCVGIYKFQAISVGFQCVWRPFVDTERSINYYLYVWQGHYWPTAFLEWQEQKHISVSRKLTILKLSSLSILFTGCTDLNLSLLCVLVHHSSLIQADIAL